MIENNKRCKHPLCDSAPIINQDLAAHAPLLLNHSCLAALFIQNFEKSISGLPFSLFVYYQ